MTPDAKRSQGPAAPDVSAKGATQTRARQFYSTNLGIAWHGDAKEVLAQIPSSSVQAIVTSPPFALRRVKSYGNPPEHEYVEWFSNFAREFHRVLRDDGSLVIEIGGAWLPKSPTRSIYHFELLVALVRDEGFHLAEEFYWYNRAKLPSPAQWVTIERSRVKDAVTPIWWLGKTERPKASNLRVLRPYSPKMIQLFERGYNDGLRPSGHKIGSKFNTDNGGSIPPNLIEVSHTNSRDPYQVYCRERGLAVHPARFPREIPKFFVKFLTEPGDLVIDPFAGSNMTGAVAESLDRRWLAIELDERFLRGSVGRFQPHALRSLPDPG